MSEVSKEFVAELTKLLAKGKMAKVIAKLSECVIADKELALLVQQSAARFATLKQQEQEGIIHIDQATIERNKIHKALLGVIDGLSSESTKQANIRSDIYHLPDLQPHFTGREKELKILDEAWANPQTNLLQFVAPGGTGKTMLLTYWLHHHLPDSKAERPSAIYAWSFFSQGSDEGR